MITKKIILRKVYRLSGFIFPSLYFWLSKREVLVILSVLAGICISAEILRRVNSGVNRVVNKVLSPIGKPYEERGVTGTTYFLIASLLTVVFFERAIAIASLCYLVVGDAAAALGGMQFGRLKIWGKTLEGSLCCLSASLLTGFLLLLNNSLCLTMGIVICGAVSATLIELAPWRVNDNLTIALASGLAMSLFRLISS